MSIVSALVAGGVVGVRHALEADHLAAIGTMVEDGDRPGLVGVSWGVGHSIPIAVVGLLFVALGVRLPTAVTHLFEGVVGVVLVVLGSRMLLRAAGVSLPTLRAHDHDGTTHRHLSLGDVAVGTGHSHVDGESFTVGVVHGFAGSGALVVALVSAAPAMRQALAFLGTFTLLTIATMAVVATLWGRSLDAGGARLLRGVAGVVGVGVGVVLLVETVGTLV